MALRKIGWQSVAIDRVCRDPGERRFLSRDILASDELDLQDQGLIRRQIERLVGDDYLAIEMRAHGHSGSFRRPRLV